jgi:C1A family cysteine protease
MKFALISLAALVAGTDVKSSFVDFVKTYNKAYTVDEFFNRFEIFQSNMALAEEHNAKSTSWTMGVTQFADLTGEEFSKLYLGKVFRKERFENTQQFTPQRENDDPAFDWRSKGAVSPVRNQGQCGSCWAITVVAAVESACYILNHNLTQQSVQALMDCSGSIGNQGCNGGYVDESFKWLQSNFLPEDACYPYTAESGTSCKKTCPPIKKCKVTGFKDVAKGDEAAMMTALNKQPLAAVIEADQSAFQMYTGGVIDSPTCGKNLDHTALLIGYGTDSGKQYWTLQNSWGTTWGEQGYVRMVRNKDMCGLADMVSYPLVANP